MKYEHTIEIRGARERVVELFLDVSRRAAWQKAFVSSAALEGVPGEVGSTALLQHRMGTKLIEMVETLETLERPRAVHYTYDAGKVWNRVENHFSESAPGRTTWRAVNEFRLGGAMKVIGATIPWMFKRQSLQVMQDFRHYAEAELGGEND